MKSFVFEVQCCLRCWEHGLLLAAQVITPMELSDPKAQHLQQRYLKALMAIGNEIEAHKFPYPFYFSRVLDVDLAKMQAGRSALHPL